MLFKNTKPRKQVILSKMFAKIVIGVLFVSVLPCESKNQKFIEVPFDDGISTQNTVQFTSESPQIVHNGFVRTALNEQPHQHFTSHEQQVQGNFHNQVLRTNNHITTNSRRQSTVTEEELLRNSALRVQLQNDGQSSFHGHLDRGLLPVHQVRGSTRHVPSQASPEAHLSSFSEFPASTSYTRSQPVQSFDFGAALAQPTHSQLSHRTVNMPSRTRQFNEAPTFDSNVNSDYELLNAVANSKPSPQPVNAFIGVEEPTLRFTAQPTQELEKPANIAHFIQQMQQPAVRTISTPPQPTFNSRLIQPNHQEVSQHPRFPQQPHFLINAQPEGNTQSRFFVSQRASTAPGPEALRTPNSNLALQNSRQQEREEEIFKQQAESAKYSFASQIDDSINGNQHQREEVRDGLNVKGMYSYSDGYVKRTVFYEADDKGYRVVKEQEEPLGNGPQVNPKGHANVSSYVAGNAVQYSITAEDIQENKHNEVQANSFNI